MYRLKKVDKYVCLPVYLGTSLEMSSFQNLDNHQLVSFKDITLRDFLKRWLIEVSFIVNPKEEARKKLERLILKDKIPIQSIILNRIPLAKNYMKNFTPKDDTVELE